MFVNFNMYKLLPIFLFSFGFAETVEIYYTTDTPIAGFQFNVNGVEVIDSDGGAAKAAGFKAPTSNNTVIGFSLEGYTIPAGNGILLVLDVDGNTDNICLTDVIISDNDGESLDVTVEDCISIKISETIEKSSYTFTVLFKNNQGINVGNPVDMLGKKIGKVSHTNSTEQKNTVELSIDNSYAFSIPLDSEFEVKVDSLIGRYISITPGYNIKDFILPREIIKGLKKFVLMNWSSQEKRVMLYIMRLANVGYNK